MPKKRIIIVWIGFGLLFWGSRPVHAAENPVPILAYYYIWFDHSSWNRAKTDYPLLGRYSSDDRLVMEQHVLWAQAAGIDGFIVSWKRTEVLNPRLEQLMEVARAAEFKLLIIYQGLDFERDPLPVERVSSDLTYFKQTYAQDPVFDLFGRPVVIWSGTWRFTTEEIATLTAEHRDGLSILASERNLEGYARLSSLVDGNAYYWSSVNPETYPNYQRKLSEMGAAVHNQGGLWIAPAAPGFDARLIGGSREVDRHEGETLRTELQTAFNSSPDAIGLISWNEFSENSHVEPSERYGDFYLEVLAAYNEVFSPVFYLFDSDGGDSVDLQRPTENNGRQIAASTIILGALLLSIVVIAWRYLHAEGVQ